MTHIDIVLDGPPGHESGRFVEVENAEGRSINAGKWLQRADGYWVLRIQQAAGVAVEEQDKPSAVCTSPLPTTLEEYESLKLFWRGEGYAVGCLAEKALREALEKAAEQFEFYEREHKARARRDSDTVEGVNRLIKAEANAKFARMCRTALSASNDSGEKRE